MIKCRSCGHKNIAGTEDCESCSVPLYPKPKMGLSAKIEESTITDLSPRKAITVTPADTVEKAALLMREHKMGCVLVVEDGKISGIMTERDILFGIAGIKDPAAVKTCDIMHKDPVCLQADDPVSYAFHHMSVGGYRHLPVYDGNKPIGMISARDLLRHLTENQA